MRPLIEYLKDANLIFPDLGVDCICSDGGKYTVIDYCYSNEKEHIRKMCKQYDQSGAMWDEYRSGNLPRKGLLVALKSDDDGSTSVWQWNSTWIKNAWM